MASKPMTPGELKKAFKARQFPSLLLLYGEERFFLEETLDNLLQLVVPSESRDFNYNLFHGKTARGAEIYDVARTFPVFSSLRLVVVRDAQLLPAAELEKLLPYLQDPVAETVLVLTADKVDGRRKFYQQFKKRGSLVEFKKYYDNQIPAFVRDRAGQNGVTFAEPAMALFCRRVGSNLQEIAGELDKLTTYLGERTVVDVDDVQTIVSDTRIDSVFELTDAIGRQDSSRALSLLNRLLADGTAPLVVLAMMARHFRQMWKARYLLDQRLGKKEVARGIGINPYFLDGLLQQVRVFPAARYQRVFEQMLEVDLALKSSGAHASALLEEMVLGICQQEHGT
jgi:DNA polymerase-3 subunit delta